MSTFRRTASGIQNQHLFYDVDIIVFLEGGVVSYSKAQVYDGNSNNLTNDIFFWKPMFERFKPDLRMKFKSVGSKQTLQEIAIDVLSGEITTVMVAMDSEFDGIIVPKAEHPNIFYTYGYSWENDLWNASTIARVVRHLSAMPIDENVIVERFDKFLKEIRIAVYADCYLFQRKSSFFSRSKGYLGCLDCTKDFPEVKKDVIDEILGKKELKRRTLNAFGKRKQIRVQFQCFGHFLADFCFHFIRNYLRAHCNINAVSKDIVFRVGLINWMNNLPPEVLVHHQSQFER